MKRVRFTGRGRLHVYGYELGSGDSALMTDEQAAALAANPRVQVTVTNEPGAGDGEGQPTDQHDEEEEPDASPA